MSNQSINLLLTSLLVLFLVLIAGCQNSVTKPTSTNSNIEQLKKDPPLRIPNTYVEGIVYNGSNPVNGATVQLLETDQTVLASTTTNSIVF